MSRAAIHSARWRARNPDKATENGRRSQRRRTIANREMRARFPDEYEAVCLSLAEEGLTDMRRYRAAVAILRDRHPEAWQDCLALAREKEPAR